MLQSGTADNFRIERSQEYKNRTICGIDEVGRAPLAGPVTAACVYIPRDRWDDDFWTNVTDSKKIPKTKRVQIFEKTCELCFYGVGWASPSEIARYNIHHASLYAMHRAFLNLYRLSGISPDLALVDGRHAPEMGVETRTIVKGDLVCKSISAASVIAKVVRDELMEELHLKYPDYKWNTNVGYPTKDHLQALKMYGPTPHHRKSFAGVKEFFEPPVKQPQKPLIQA